MEKTRMITEILGGALFALEVYLNASNLNLKIKYKLYKYEHFLSFLSFIFILTSILIGCNLYRNYNTISLLIAVFTVIPFITFITDLFNKNKKDIKYELKENNFRDLSETEKKKYKSIISIYNPIIIEINGKNTLVLVDISLKKLKEYNVLFLEKKCDNNKEYYLCKRMIKYEPTFYNYIKSIFDIYLISLFVYGIYLLSKERFLMTKVNNLDDYLVIMFLPIVYAVFRYVSEEITNNKKIKPLSYYIVCTVRILVAILLAIVFLIW